MYQLSDSADKEYSTPTMIAKSIYLLHFLVASLFVTGNGQGFFGPSNPFEHNIAPNPGHGGYQGYYGGGDTSAGLPFGRLFQQHQQRQQSFNQLHHQAQAQGYGHSQGFGPLSPQLPNFFGGRSPFAGNPFAPSAPPSPVAAASSSSCSAAVPPKIDYGDCPTLEAKEEDKMKKEEKQKECLKDLEVSENSTVEALGQPLQDKVRECVLRKEELVSVLSKHVFDIYVYAMRVLPNHSSCNSSACWRFFIPRLPITSPLLKTDALLRYIFFLHTFCDAIRCAKHAANFKGCASALSLACPVSNPRST